MTTLIMICWKCGLEANFPKWGCWVVMVMAIEVGSGALSLIVQSLHTRHTASIYELDWDQTFSARSRQSTAYHIGT